MSRQFLAVAAIMVLLFSSCEDEIKSSFELSDKTKSLVSYNVGDSWTYDVSLNRDVYLETRHLIVDTIILKSRERYGQRFDFSIYQELGVTYRQVKFDTTLHLKDSVYLFGEYRVYESDQIISDSVRTFRRLPVYGVTGDTTIFKAYYSIYDTIFHDDPADNRTKFEDVRTVLSVEEGEFTNEMRNTETREDYWKAEIESSLNTHEKYIDLLVANSSGFEYYKRQIERRQEFINAFEIGLKENVVDTTRFDEGLGIYSYEENGDITVLKTKYDAENVVGNLITNDVEYWISKNGGIQKIINYTDKTSWTQK